MEGKLCFKVHKKEYLCLETASSINFKALYGATSTAHEFSSFRNIPKHYMVKFTSRNFSDHKSSYSTPHTIYIQKVHTYIKGECKLAIAEMSKHECPLGIKFSNGNFMYISSHLLPKCST